MPLFTLGSISHGTMRLQDTLPAMLDALEQHCPAEYEQLLMLPFGPIPSHAEEDDDTDWWNSQHATDVYLEIYECLNNACPFGVYFGAHPGDGSDLGFWIIEDLDDHADACDIPRVAAGTDHGHTGDMLEINDHGNVTYLYVDPTTCKRTEYWSCV